MAKTLQFRRGTSAELDAITGAEGELFVDLDSNTIRVHDGSTAGGTNLGDYDNLINKPDLTQYDNVDFHSDQSTFPVSGETYKIYVAEDTGYIYRWTGSVYSQIGGETPTWGSITGTLSSQTDLQSALDAKADSSSISAVGLSGSYNDLTNKPDLSVYDEVLPYANQAAFPASGATGKVYVAEDTGYIYRWSGSAYVQLTDQTAIWGQISGTLSNQSDLSTALSGKQATLVSGTNIKTVDGNSLLGSGDIPIANKTITLSGDVSGSGTTSISVSLGSNVVGADELNVSGNGTAGQALLSDGDGSFSWGDAGGGNPTITTSNTNSAFKVPFADTTASTTGEYGLLQDSTATFTYNPLTNVLTAGSFSGSGHLLTSLQATQISGTLSANQGVNSNSSSLSFIQYYGYNRNPGVFYGGTNNPPNEYSNAYTLNFNGPLRVSNLTVSSGVSASSFSGGGSGLYGVNGSGLVNDLTPSSGIGIQSIGLEYNYWANLWVTNINLVDDFPTASGSVRVFAGLTVSRSGAITTTDPVSLSELVSTSALLGDLLVTDNLITPDASTVNQYLGDKGILVVNGNLDVQGDWIKAPVVETISNFYPNYVWEAGANVTTPREFHCGAGDSTACLIWAGSIGATQYTSHDSTEYWNGSTWSGRAAFPVATAQTVGTGTSADAIGTTSLFSTTVYRYNFAANFWSQTSNLPGNLNDTLCMTGPVDNSIIFNVAYSTNYKFNGSGWSSIYESVGFGANYTTAVGDADNALIFGGGVYGQPANRLTGWNGLTMFNAGPLPFQTFASQFSYNPTNLNLPLYNARAAAGGKVTDAVVTFDNDTYMYDGIAFSAAPDQPLRRHTHTSGGNTNTTGKESIITAGGRTEGSGLQALSYAFAPEVDLNGDPVGTTELVPPLVDGEVGMIRYNMDEARFEGYNGTAWVSLQQI